MPSQLNDRERFSLWQEIHVAEIWSVEYGIAGDRPFEAAIQATAVGSLVLGQMAGTIRQATRKARNIAADGNDGYLLLINKADTVSRSGANTASVAEKRSWSQRLKH